MSGSGEEKQSEIPFGPLTPEDHDRLSGSFYDGSQLELQRIATERGVQPGETSLRRFQVRLEKAIAEGRVVFPPSDEK